MASNENKTTILIPSKDSQTLILDYLNRIMVESRRVADYINKMQVVDVAYARYKGAKTDANGIVSGEGIDAATTPVGVIDMPSTTPPVVVSQVDSMVGYLAEVFLSGTPMFPVVSNPSNKEDAEKLEVLMDDHAILGGYARQFLMFLKDGVKYNLSAIEVAWDSIEQYSSINELLQPGTNKTTKKSKFYNRAKRLDPYNTIWDINTAPGDISEHGEYAGYVELLSRNKLKRFLQKLADNGKAFNVREALASTAGTTGDKNLYYRLHPQVSEYVAARKPLSELNWYTYLTGKEDVDNRPKSDNFEVTTLYVRVVPSELRLNAPAPKNVQIWKFIVVNNTILVSAERIVSAYDLLPILFGQPLEDGLGYQTQSIAEGSIPFQTASSTLFNISFNAARRAVADRALYDSNVIRPEDVNAPVPAAKIPVRVNSLAPNKSIRDYYHQIPFDSRGTEGALQSGMQIVGFGKELSGLNNPQQGQFQKGNKSVQEWQDTMGGSDARLRLPALILEHQVFQRFKYMSVLNIFQYGDDAILISQQTGKEVEINIAELRQKVLSFRVADGYTPKSKLASTDALVSVIQLIGTSPILQQSYGAQLPNIVAHLAQLMGIRGMNEYIPQQPQIQMQQTIGGTTNVSGQSTTQ